MAKFLDRQPLQVLISWPVWFNFHPLRIFAILIWFNSHEPTWYLDFSPVRFPQICSVEPKEVFSLGWPNLLLVFSPPGEKHLLSQSILNLRREKEIILICKLFSQKLTDIENLSVMLKMAAFLTISMVTDDNIKPPCKHPPCKSGWYFGNLVDISLVT